MKGEKKPKEECDLYLSINPLYYIQITRRMRVPIMISSNCYGTKEVFLEVNIKKENRINFDWHPTHLNLFFWDNLYTIDFSRPKVLDKIDIMITKEY